MDNERPIEGLLREARKARLEQSGPPPELHPANRRMLQDQVRRSIPAGGKTGQGSRWGWGQWWPRLSWTAGFAVVVATIIWVAVPARKDVGDLAAIELRRSIGNHRQVERQPGSEIAAPKADERFATALNDKAKHSNAFGTAGALELGALKESRSEGAPVPPPAMETLAKGEANQPTSWHAQGEFGLHQNAPSLPAAAPASPARTLSAVSPDVRLGTDARVAQSSEPGKAAARKGAEVNYGSFFRRSEVEAIRPYQTASAPVAASPATRATKSYEYFSYRDVAQSNAGESSSGVLSSKMKEPDESKFRALGKASERGLAGAAKAVPEFSLLQEFSIRQQGDKITITDEDGSVYSGTTPATTTFGARDAAGMAGGIQFAVSGTNLTLGRLILFKGSLFPAQPAATNAVSGHVRGEISSDGSSVIQVEAFQSAK